MAKLKVALETSLLAKYLLISSLAISFGLFLYNITYFPALLAQGALIGKV